MEQILVMQIMYDKWDILKHETNDTSYDVEEKPQEIELVVLNELC